MSCFNDLLWLECRAFCSAFFMAVWMCEYVRTFTSSVRSVYKSRRGHTGANRQVFTPLHSNASSRVRAVFDKNQIPSKICLLWYSIWYDSNTVRNTNVHKVHRLRVSTFTNPDGGVVKTNRLILHCIRTFRVGFEPYQILYQKRYFFECVWVSRIRLEPSSNTFIYKSRRGCSENQ